MNLKEGEERRGYIGGFGSRKEKEKCYIIISKNFKKKIKKKMGEI